MEEDDDLNQRDEEYGKEDEEDDIMETLFH